MKHVKASITIEKKPSSADSVCIHLIPEVHYKVMGHSLERREQRGLPVFAIPGTRFTIPLTKPRTGAVIFCEMQKGTNANELHVCLFREKDGGVEVIESPGDEQVCERWDRVQALGQTAFLETEKGWFVTIPKGEVVTETLKLKGYRLVQANSFFRYVFGHTKIGALETSARRLLDNNDKETLEINLLNDIIGRQNLELTQLKEECNRQRRMLMDVRSRHHMEMNHKNRWITKAKTILAKLSGEKCIRSLDDDEISFIMEIANIVPPPDMIKSCQKSVEEAKSQDWYNIKEFFSEFRSLLPHFAKKVRKSNTEK